jgi:hypothetical protein
MSTSVSVEVPARFCTKCGAELRTDRLLCPVCHRLGRMANRKVSKFRHFALIAFLAAVAVDAVASIAFPSGSRFATSDAVDTLLWVLFTGITWSIWCSPAVRALFLQPNCQTLRVYRIVASTIFFGIPVLLLPFLLWSFLPLLIVWVMLWWYSVPPTDPVIRASRAADDVMARVRRYLS